MSRKGVQSKDKKKMLRVRHFREKMDRSKSYLDGGRNEGEGDKNYIFVYRTNTCASHTMSQGLTKHM